MPEEDSKLSIDEAFALATADETGEATPVVEEPTQPVESNEPARADEQASTDDASGEQSESQNEIDALIQLAVPEGGAAGLAPDADGFWDQQVEVTIDGVPTTMTLGEMRDGTMMRADYTKKTQEVARDRKLAEEAVEFYSWFRKDPTQASLYLAQKAGIATGDAVPSTEFDFGSANESVIDERVQEAVQKHPDVIEAQKNLAQGQVEQTFAAIERAYGEPLSVENRRIILEQAKKSGTTDLGLVFDALIMRGSQLRQAQAEVAAVSTEQSGGTPTQGQPTAAPEINTVDDAFDFAIRSLAETVSA